MLRVCLSIGLVLLLLGYTAHSEAEQKQEIEELSQSLQVLEAFGFSGVVSIKAKDQVLLQEAYGYANVKTRTSNTIDTKFPLLSMTKPMLAAGILLLEEQGKVELNASISDYVPSLHSDKIPITLHHLLTHTSGLVPNKKVRQKDINEFLKQVNDLDRDSMSGIKRRYCNMCYSLVAAVLEIISEISWRDSMEQWVLKASGMENARIMRAARSSDIATGYRDHPLVSQPMVMSDGPDYINEMWWSVAGARGVAADVNDVLHWLESLQSDRLLSAESRQKMFTRYIGDQGYGWHIDESNGQKRYWKGGGAPMYETQMVIYPDTDIKVVLLLNNNMGWRVPVWRLIENSLFSGDIAQLPTDELKEPTVSFTKLVNESETVALTVMDSSSVTVKIEQLNNEESHTVNLLFDAEHDRYLGLRPRSGESGFAIYQLRREGDEFGLTLPSGESYQLIEH
ncbi:serine hydrolase domain-containing protein [Kangiella shandongensis]|uniref:serine hydrolase domain-containing protein n=1 Tax=Kangiella shandongensis TaxID=2763258 RepID=UPI001CBEAFEC|nr:serine hydrolase domain-containing protein [Kangiella shandongensis]